VQRLLLILIPSFSFQLVNRLQEIMKPPLVMQSAAKHLAWRSNSLTLAMVRARCFAALCMTAEALSKTGSTLGSFF
jgi:hypothetical protein